MLRIALALLFALTPYPAMAQTSDTVDLEIVNESYALLIYHNSAANNSREGFYVAREGGLVVTYFIDQGLDEVIRVFAPTGWVAIPEQDQTHDGGTVVIELRRGEYLGG